MLKTLRLETQAACVLMDKDSMVYLYLVYRCYWIEAYMQVFYPNPSQGPLVSGWFGLTAEWPGRMVTPWPSVKL